MLNFQKKSIVKLMLQEGLKLWEMLYQDKIYDNWREKKFSWKIYLSTALQLPNLVNWILL